MDNENVVITEENTTLENQDCYVKHSEFTILKEEVEDIRDNHLVSILTKIENLVTKAEVKNLRWFIMAGFVILGLVIAIKVA